MTEHHSLRWLLALLFTLPWATTGSAGALVERSDFGYCTLAARGVTAPFKSGEIITREFASSGGPVEMAAEAIINGRTLHLKDIAVFPKGAEKLDIGMKEVLRLRAQLADEVAGMGFDTLRITGTRLTGANPGKAVDMTIDLTKKAAGQ
jgi:hypothetical protein